MDPRDIAPDSNQQEGAAEAPAAAAVPPAALPTAFAALNINAKPFIPSVNAPATVPSPPPIKVPDSDGAPDPGASEVTQTVDSIMLEYARILERLRPSLGRGSPLSEKLREQIVQQYRNNVSQRTIARNLGISPSTIHNIIKRYKESGEISARKGQGRKPTLNAHELESLRQYYSKHPKDCVKDITIWAREQFGKPLSENTVRRLIYNCK